MNREKLHTGMREKMEKSDLLERYLFEVIKRLPEKQKDDIKKELETLIEDMLLERCMEKEAEAEDMWEVLQELGDPALLAAEYRGTKNHLIGGEYYDKYIYILKIALPCTGIAILAAQFVSIFTASSIKDVIFDFGMIPSVLIQMFAWITIGFVIMERSNVDLNELGNQSENWSPDKLPQLPYEKAMIKRGESAFGIIFGIFCIAAFYLVPHIAGITKIVDGELYTVSLFHVDTWSRVLPILIFCFVLDIILESIKLVAGHYNVTVAVSTVILNVIGLALMFFVFLYFDVWNPEFIAGVKEEITLSANTELWFIKNFNAAFLSGIILFIASIISISEIIQAVYKFIRYGKRK